MTTINPNKLGLLQAFKAPGMIEAYRKWSTDPATAQYLALAADLVAPNPSTPETRSSHSEAVSMLVRRETAEEFMLACLKLEDFAMLGEGTELPPSDYGAGKAGRRTEKVRKAEPAQA